MRIGLFTNRFFPSIGGVEVSSRLMAQALVELGHEVTVFIRSPRGDAAELDEGYRIERDISFLRLAMAGARQDVMILRGGLSKFALLASAVARTRVVVLHEMALQVEHPKSLARRVLLSLVDHHVGVSHASLRTIGIPAGVPRSVLYNPVAANLWGDWIEPYNARTIDILFVGRLISDKGIWVLTEALSHLDIPVTLSIVGDGPERAALGVQLAEIGNIATTFHGTLTGASLRGRYAESRLFVMPSEVIEGMGMVVAEALANGTPVVISDQAPLRETAGRGGIAFEKGNSKSLKDSIVSLLSDPALWQEHHAAALHERDRFGLATYRQQLSMLISAAVRA